ncbi:hypothetical protein AAFP30_17365 [Gordonia sp. CPCC 205515]|uniref:hypothetical protein n=1 Tax=Gordonia sp. CPCC 205515 TaxID=3140791 RepID=UPI003AF3692D
MEELIEHIKRKAEITPSLTAVRFGEDSVTFGGLSTSLRAYEDVMSSHALSSDAAMIPALMNCIPGIASVGEPTKQMRIVNEVIGWLSRDLGGGTDNRLRAVS